MKNVGEKATRVDLSNIGPSADLVVRRHIIASDDLFKKAMRKPKTKVCNEMRFLLNKLDDDVFNLSFLV